MKKLPSLFERKYDNHKVVGITRILTTPELHVVVDGKCDATLKIDGSCCACINGKFYKRYDAKKGKQPPAGAIPCCEPDQITGHWPHWIPVSKDKKEDNWFLAAKEAYEKDGNVFSDGTYEAIGVHFQDNPYELDKDTLCKHGSIPIEDLGWPTFESIRLYLKEHYIEGIVFWYKGEPLCKIKRSDFGFPWKTSKKW